MHYVELVGLRTLHIDGEDLEPSQTTDMVNDLSHVGPFEATQQTFVIDFKALETGHFIVVLLLLFVQLINCRESCLL